MRLARKENNKPHETPKRYIKVRQNKQPSKSDVPEYGDLSIQV